MTFVLGVDVLFMTFVQGVELTDSNHKYNNIQFIY